mmetsp:Transcript_14421/g.45089  ORF Transcript_14421/g.45089 Transcript_14421/m.45089 type:complete len:235 (-) Transcript_14421:310-1014(-)
MSPDYDYMNASTPLPRAIAPNVAVAYPSTPTNMPGTRLDRQPLAAAKPAAVVGPPTLALDASSTSRFRRPSSLPSPSASNRCTAICTKQKANSAGALVSTAATLPAAAPMAAKNTCIIIVERPSALGTSGASCRGKAVASATASAVMATSANCGAPAARESATPPQQSTADSARLVAPCTTLMSARFTPLSPTASPSPSPSPCSAPRFTLSFPPSPSPSASGGRSLASQKSVEK